MVFLSAAIAVLAVAAVLMAGCGSSGSGTSQTPSSTSASVTAHVQRQRKHAPVQRVAVPQLVGQRFGRSVRELNRHGLRQNSAGFPGSDSSPAMHGCTRIISQAPAAGTKVPEHSTIHVTIGMTSLGRASC